MNKNLVVLCAALSTLGCPVAGSATEPANLSLCVSVNERVKPDEFVLSWTYQNVDKSAANAMARVDGLSREGLEHLKSLGVDDDRISASNIELSTETGYDEHDREIQLGHRAARDFKIRFERLDDAGKMIGLLPEGEEISIDGLRPAISDRAEQKTRLRQVAAERLQREAEAAAALFGQRVVALHDLSDRSTFNSNNSTLESITVTGAALPGQEPVLAQQLLKEGTIEIGQRLCGTFLISTDKRE